MKTMQIQKAIWASFATVVSVCALLAVVIAALIK